MSVLKRQTTMEGAPPSILLALEIVERKATKLRDSGLSALTFSLGIANLLVSAFLMGAYPESFWLVYALQASAILGCRVSVMVREARGPNPKNNLCFLLDFCWVMNFVFAASALVLLVEVAADWWPWLSLPRLRFASSYPNFATAAFLVATGPLGWSVVALNQALLLHDIAHYSSTFIHLWPVSLFLYACMGFQAKLDIYETSMCEHSHPLNKFVPSHKTRFLQIFFRFH
mmetsp:Transcript_11396/g.22891  ORF Transcript_11396/g.22891 Transcript_11396/m.22891 type:complete len:230 (-) Transcript_11396:1047-1736(-)